MFISEIMEIGASICTEDTSLKDVYELIQDSKNGYVVVIDSLQHRVPIGIVSEHSICENLVGRSRPARTADAGRVMSTNVKRVRENAEVNECEHVLDRGADAILVVDERRRFLGTVDAGRLQLSIDTRKRHYHTQGIFSGVAGQHVPAAVEIPAFGWLK